MKAVANSVYINQLYIHAAESSVKIVLLTGWDSSSSVYNETLPRRVVPVSGGLQHRGRANRSNLR